MTSETAQYGLIAGLAALLLVAAFTDWKRREIDNWLNLTLALTAPLFWWATGLGFADIGWQFAAFGVVFIVFGAFFAIGAMGGGDLKLLMALALWLLPLEMLRLSIIMSIIGGVLTVVMLVRQRALKIEGKPEIPYGIAITLAGLWSIYERYINHFPSSVTA
jgi:prepilin peptidase CpaA